MRRRNQECLQRANRAADRADGFLSQQSPESSDGRVDLSRRGFIGSAGLAAVSARPLP